ncbi:hypothetical protein [Nocardioides sp. B-3]|uniref:hypothetical protein n=1 Tax=Nocardioides sp. B-3 TaxID=2895565 RepID=UPI002152BB19|nr:hypothetical protein [Nocardioides sp. B-3]UUZ61449.1 hypothetical protein LP418_13290 [Nocardioides sp. B-3]
MKTDRRIVEWIDLVGDLLQRPQDAFPVATIATQLNRTFAVGAISPELARALRTLGRAALAVDRPRRHRPPDSHLGGGRW